MKNKIFLVVILLAAGFLCFGTEPNNEPNSIFNPVEAQMLALEKRLDALEQRVNRLELRRTPPTLPANETPKVEGEQKRSRQTDPTSPADVNRDALRVERLRKQIQDATNAIELADTRIENLPPIPILFRIDCDPRMGWGKIHYRLHPDEVSEITKALEIAKEKYQLLSDQESNLKKILQLGEKYSDLGVDIMDTKKTLIECQGRKEKAEQDKECLRAVILANPDRFNIMPR
jgi:cell division septum initiation protein DivIVA